MMLKFRLEAVNAVGGNDDVFGEAGIMKIKMMKMMKMMIMKMRVPVGGNDDVFGESGSLPEQVGPCRTELA